MYIDDEPEIPEYHQRISTWERRARLAKETWKMMDDFRDDVIRGIRSTQELLKAEEQTRRLCTYELKNLSHIIHRCMEP